MRKFYLFNWMLLLIGLISSTAFGQTEILTINRSHFPTGTGYVASTWTATASTGEAITGQSNLFLTQAAHMQIGGSQLPHPYNSVEIPGAITKIQITMPGSGSPREWTPRVSESNVLTSASGGTSLTPQTFASNSGTLTWDLDASDNYKFFYLQAGGNTNIASITIEYEVATSCEASNLTFTDTTVNKDLLDPSFTQTATSLNGTTAITYESSDELVATVNATTGEVTLVGVGTATITATQAAGEHSGVDYCAGTATYDVVVTTVPVLTVSTDNVSFSGFAGGAAATEDITVEGFNLTGNIALALSGDTNFSINPTSLSSTGGEVTITYTPSATPATHSATLTVSNGLLSEVITLSGVTNEMPVGPCFEGQAVNQTIFERGGSTTTGGGSPATHIRLGSGSNSGTLTTSTLAGVSGNVTFRAEVRGWAPAENMFFVDLGGVTGTGTVLSSFGNDSSTTFEWVEVELANVPENSILQIMAEGGGSGKAGRITFRSIELICTPATPSTTWDGTAWSNGVPTIDVDAIVDGALEISADLAAKSVTVNTNGSVVVKSGYALTVDGAIVNNATAAAFVVENDANLIQVQDVANTGEFTVYRNSNPMVRNDMTLWSSPVAAQSLRDFSPETLYNHFWTYNEGTNAYQALFTADTQDQDFESGLGYAIRVKNTLPTGETTVHEGAFTGNLNNGDVAVNTVFTTSGNNLVGNPYPSNIAVQGTNGFLAANADVNALYFWTQTYPVGSPNYNSNYVAFSQAGSTLGDVENISVGQGFFVNVDNAGQVVFNNAMRTADASTFYRTEIEKNRMWLSLNKEEQKLSQILVAYMTDATNELDHQIDAKVFAKGQASIYTLINAEAYAIQGRALPFDQEDVVALGFEATEQGTYSINIEAVDGLFAEGQEVYLLDKSANKIHDLATAYTFESEAGIFDERFEVVYANRDLGLNTDLTNSKDVVVYTDNNTIVVESKNATLLSVELIDLQGRTVAAKNNIKANTYRVNTSAKGVLIVKIQTVDGKIITKKVIRK